MASNPGSRIKKDVPRRGLNFSVLKFVSHLKNALSHSALSQPKQTTFLLSPHLPERLNAPLPFSSFFPRKSSQLPAATISLVTTSLSLDIFNNALLQGAICGYTHSGRKRGCWAPLAARPRRSLFEHIVDLLQRETLGLRHDDVGIDAGAGAEPAPNEEHLGTLRAARLVGLGCILLHRSVLSYGLYWWLECNELQD